MELKTIDYFSKQLTERIPDPEFRSFVERFLKWNPRDRITPMEALKSDWIQEGIPEHLRKMEAFVKTEPETTKSTTLFKLKTKSR